MTPTLSPPTSRPPGDFQHLVLDNVSWAFYEQLLLELGRRRLRVTFDRGRLEIMSPLPEHEMPSRLIGRLIQTITFTLDLPIRSWGSTTFRREDVARGLEPDECFFVQNEARVRGLKQWDPKSDPPPDLAVESDITSPSIDREPIYAALGVPELWRWNGFALQCLRLSGDTYRLSERSLALPMIAPADLTPFVTKLMRDEENAVIREFTKWLATLRR